MVLSRDDAARGLAVQEAADPSPRTITIYEVWYTDTARVRSGEPAQEAASRVFFESLGAAQHFQREVRGEILPVQKTANQVKYLRTLGLLGPARHGNRKWRK